ncbi:lysophospholipid acyltransferase family protein [Clostridium aestuarii]|uniref:1-acyl-sn-glycerol-3-phosphate acyltransferase n=1 Tax=Clostridium aestuarii TaxID=338193 RepID=A0ABT4CZD8_9CLOT|nr:lysophospholipid acyltransferase family protein [Clostridium aestuarii]MCY6484351.1 lysophospholipid acyltransferase family protein [Clostridium aestuarii]
MKTVLVYIYFAFNMIVTIFFKIKLNYLRKHKTKEETEKYIHKIVINWANNLLKVVGVTIKAEGLENIPEEACCFVGNHQGNFDILAIIAAIDKPIGFIAKKELKKLKIVSGWMKEIKCVFIDRSDIRESLKAINEGAENLKNGHSMVIFPEGTRSRERQMGEFKKGSLKMALKAKAPIVPVTIDGSYKIFEKNNGRFRKGDIKLIVGKPIYINNMTREEQKKLSKLVKNEIEKNL